jgi:penicillin-binding protein 2
MPSTLWKLKTQHEKWYAGGPSQSASDRRGHRDSHQPHHAQRNREQRVLQRPHVIFPDEVPPEMLRPSAKFSRLRRRNHPLSPENWQLITDAMASVARSPIGTPISPPQGVDFASKTGKPTLADAQKTKQSTIPNLVRR